MTTVGAALRSAKNLPQPAVRVNAKPCGFAEGGALFSARRDESRWERELRPDEIADRR